VRFTEATNETSQDQRWFDHRMVVGVFQTGSFGPHGGRFCEYQNIVINVPSQY